MSDPDNTLSHRDMLEVLITKAFKFLNKEDTNGDNNGDTKEDTKDRIEAKIGEWIKMMELHRKLAPADTDRNEFWEMLEQIRRDKLPAGKAPAGVKKPAESKAEGRKK